jgi:hypothetical protein
MTIVELETKGAVKVSSEELYGTQTLADSAADSLSAAI